MPRRKLLYSLGGWEGVAPIILNDTWICTGIKKKAVVTTVFWWERKSNYVFWIRCQDLKKSNKYSSSQGHFSVRLGIMCTNVGVCMNLCVLDFFAGVSDV